MTATLPASLTAYQKLAIFNEQTGLNVRLRPFEAVVSVAVGSDSATIILEGHRYEERSREYKLNGRFKRMIMVDSKTGVTEMTMDEPDFVPVAVKKFDWPTQAERQEKREWERMCHRPAGDRDSHARLAQGYEGAAPKGAVR